MGMARSERISGAQLRARVERLGLTYTAAAPLFGLTLDGLRKQMGGVRPVSRQTEIILKHLEHEQVITNVLELVAHDLTGVREEHRR